ncbi:MAG: Uma2 family endonuclease [Oscillatoriales cyanobacterium]|nr:MAG: Uma2 family endonuclease [Oscillatoriales cyanobacterium]
MLQTPTKTLTLEEFLNLPETEPASEYINGRIIQKPMPQGEHSAIQTELPPAINRAFCELRCTFGGRSIIPDVSIFLWNRIPRQENGAVANVFSIAPDWTIEILSPDQSQTKVTKNILHCLARGTQMGWLIDPSEQCVFVYLRDRPTAFFDEPDVLLPVPEFAREFNLTVKGLFSWLLD